MITPNGGGDNNSSSFSGGGKGGSNLGLILGITIPAAVAVDEISAILESVRQEYG